MKTELELIRDGHEVLDRICGCDHLNCAVCKHRKEVRGYLDVADRKPFPIEIEVSDRPHAALQARSDATGKTIDEIVAEMVP